MRICGVEIDDALGLEYRRGASQSLLRRLSDVASADTDGAAQRCKPSTQFLRGLCLVALGELVEARQVFLGCENELPVPCRVQLANIDILAHRALPESLQVLAEASLQAQEDDSILGCIWHLQGLAWGKMRQTARATAALLEGLRYYRLAHDPWSIAQVRDTLGTVEAARGRLEHSLQFYALALVDKSLLGDRLGMAITLGNLGRIHLRTGRYLDAIECFERDRKLCEELDDRRGLCRMHNDLGRTHLALGDWDRAEEELKQGIALAAAAGFQDIAFYCHKDLASLKIQQRDYGAAQQSLQMAQKALGPGSAPYMALAWQAVQGELLMALGDPQAVPVLAQVVEAFHQAELPDWEIPARVALAQAYLDQKQALAAERCLLSGLRLARSNGYGRYFSILNDTMTRLDIAEAAEVEQGRSLQLPDSRGETAVQPHAATQDYLIREKLGAGAFGTVYRAYDSQRGVEVALKTLHLARTYDTVTRLALLQSTKTELTAASRVRHPGVVRVYAIGEDHTGDLYICQEYVPGIALRAWMEEPTERSWQQIIPIVADVAYALDALHAQQVIHRDLKPDNILLRDRTYPVLIDFGVAQLKPPGWFERVENSGTLEYMSPEQALGKGVDARADLYALGVILYEILAGRRPIRLPSGAWPGKLSAIQTQVPRPITIYRPELPPRLVTLVHQLLEKKGRRRPASARLVAEQLQEFQA